MVFPLLSNSFLLSVTVCLAGLAGDCQKNFYGRVTTTFEQKNVKRT
jgi:hypothetical protein